MASSTPAASPIRQEHNPHPYPIKTSHTGLLTRSNSSKAHGSWSRHHYIPVPPSPSAPDASKSSPDPTRRHTKALSEAQASPSHKSYKPGSPPKSEGSISPSMTKYSKSWIGRNSAGEEIKLPRHPYLWNPAQLASYLSFELYDSDGQPLDSEVVGEIVTFLQDRKVGGRAFLSFDQEDFQEMEGVDYVWSDALWDASCRLRQDSAPYRPSRISSSAYKRGRVRGIVDVFERSASETSDVGEDNAQNSPGKSVPARRPSIDNRLRESYQKWDNSSSEEELGRQELGRPRETRKASSNGGIIPSRDSEAPLVQKLFASRVSKSPVRGDSSHDNHSVQPDRRMGDTNVNDVLAAVSPPRSSSHVDLVLIPDEFSQNRVANPLEPNDDHTPKRNTEVEIVPTHPREESEPTIAELYEQTYGVRPPSPRREQLDGYPHEELLPVETVKVVAAPSSSPDHPPTALRPVVRRKALTPPRSLRHLFVPTLEQAPDGLEPQSVRVLPERGSGRDMAPMHTLDALKERLESVERRLEAMEEKRDAGAWRFHDVAVPVHSKGKRRAIAPIEDALDGFGMELHSSRPAKMTGGEALRTWQSTCILLAGATAGISVVLIPMLFRHLWSR